MEDGSVDFFHVYLSNNGDTYRWAFEIDVNNGGITKLNTRDVEAENRFCYRESL